MCNLELRQVLIDLISRHEFVLQNEMSSSKIQTMECYEWVVMKLIKVSEIVISSAGSRHCAKLNCDPQLKSQVKSLVIYGWCFVKPKVFSFINSFPSRLISLSMFNAKSFNDDNIFLIQP